MPLSDQSTLRIVLYEGPDVKPLAAPDRFATLTSLLERGYAVTRVTGQGEVARHDRSTVLVLGRFSEGHPADTRDAEGTPVRFENIEGLDETRKFAARQGKEEFESIMKRFGGV